MAQLDINNIEKIEKTRNTIHERVYTTYTTFESEGNKYLQIDTYGKISRDNPEKLSQSIQMNKETARYLISLLKSEFDL